MAELHKGKYFPCWNL